MRKFSQVNRKYFYRRIFINKILLFNNTVYYIVCHIILIVNSFSVLYSAWSSFVFIILPPSDLDEIRSSKIIDDVIKKFLQLFLFVTITLILITDYFALSLCLLFPFWILIFKIPNSKLPGHLFDRAETQNHIGILIKL